MKQKSVVSQIRYALRRLRVWLGSKYYLPKALDQYSIDKNDIVIDCGANVGDVSKYFLKKGAVVYAFEPDPVVFEKLKRKCGSHSRFTGYNKGVWSADDTLELKLPESTKKDRINNSVGNSFLDKNNQSEETIQVEVINLANFIKSLGKQVKVLKIDIEGAEIEVIPSILDTRVHHLVDHILVETHEQSIPSTAKKMRAIRQRIKREKIININLDWH